MRNCFIGALILAAIIFDPANGAAQNLTIVSTSPDQGQVEVESSTTVSFTFSHMLDELFEPWDAYLVGPEQNLWYDGPYISEDRFTMWFDVSHFNEGQYVWVITNAEGVELNELAEPFVLRYTLADTYEDGAIYGEVTFSNSAPGERNQLVSLPSFLKNKPAAARELHVQEPSETVKALLGDKASVKALTGLKGAGTFSENDVLLLLFDGDPFDYEQEEWVNLVAAAVANSETGEYSIDRLRAGEYYLLALSNFNAGWFTHYGLYDPGQTGNISPVTLEQDQQISGIDIVMYPFADVTAGALYPAMQSIMDEFMTGFELKMVVAPFMNEPTGKTVFWVYVFYHPELEIASIARIMPEPMGLQDIEFVFLEDIRDMFPADEMNTLPATFIDSDAAFETVEQNGGASFREEILSMGKRGLFLHVMAGSHAWWLYGPNPTKSAPSFWDTGYIFFSEDEEEFFFSAMVDMETGAFLPDDPATSIEPVTNVPMRVSLNQNYPNPFNPSTTIPFELNQSSSVRITVHNSLGQQVAVVLNQELPAGRHQAGWDATGFASGIYFVRLDTGAAVMTRKMTLVK